MDDAVLHAEAIAVTRGQQTLLPPTSLSVTPGELTVVAGDPGPAHALLALALAGRLDHASGSVELAGSPSRAELQKRVALVDVPTVSEPDGAVPLRTIVGEELAMARRPAGRRHVVRWLVDQGAADPYLQEQLKTPLLEAACREAGIDATIRMQEGYDHSYLFVSSFIDDHVAWHAERLKQ